MGSSSGAPLFYYKPSIGAAIFFAILFIVTTSLHIFQAIRTRTRFVIPLIVGGCFEIIGYIGRVILSNQTPNWSTGPYIMQSLLLILAPALFAASMYMAFHRIVLLVHGEASCILRPTWLTKIFVTGDVLSFLIQGVGGGVMSNGSDSSLKSGSHIIVGGLLLQMFSLGFFIIIMALFDKKIRRLPTSQSVAAEIPWYKHIVILYVTSTLIVVRNIVRVLEYAQGNGHAGFVLRHEVFLYVLDAVPMVALMIIFNVIYLGEIKVLMRGQRVIGKPWNLKRVAMAANADKAGEPLQAEA